MVKKWASLSLLGLMVFASACSNNGGNNNAANTAEGNKTNTTAEPTETTEPAAEPEVAADPFGKYPELIEFTTIRPTMNNPKFPEGESYEENVFNKFMEEKLNAKPKFVWMAPQDGDAYKKKLDLSIGGNDIPDVFQIVGKNITEVQSTVKRLVEADMIEDLSTVYEQYASPAIKEAFASADNRGLDLYKVDGKLYGIPSQGGLENFNFVWVRDDWRKKLNLAEPKTIEDVEAIAKAFKEKDPAGNGTTVPMAMQMQTETDGLFGPGYIFDQFEAFPRLFYKDASDQVVYGGIQPQIKDSLKLIANFYKEGLIEKDFALKDTGQLQEVLASGRAGIVGQAWWGVWYPLFMTLQNVPDADWKPYAIPAKTNGKLNMGAMNTSGSVMVVKKGFKYPELPMKWLNVVNENDDTEWWIKTTQEKYKDANEKGTVWGGMTIMRTDDILNQANDIVAAVNGEKDPATLPFKNNDAFLNIKKFIDELQTQPASKNVLQWQNTRSWYDAMGSAAKLGFNTVYSAFDGQTPTMEKKLTALNELQMKAYHRIIMGKADADAEFDQFVADWKAQGGDDILKEINEALSK
ncbi:hypothetical protein [Paenibacillus lignilyticus]|uniref:Aldouronate transport system substrate-binding protein n=1 Tax=Paenibacillus lignilyticus TaxID=1172615 RepID=A0ABS5CFY0_9BACL|nr:hypothetical protein [Paenibacillus lignilyticus]MBP3964736.1 hypothetical protein [Paenibacillus lignilyticus]